VTRIAGGPDNEEAAARLGISAHRIMVKPDGARLDRLAALVDRGKIKAEIAKTFPLADAADAQRMSKDGHVRGKIVLLMPGGSSIG
jgi:NADPH:quinone reductase-like Zn-dependent oxidoreductase